MFAVGGEWGHLSMREESREEVLSAAHLPPDRPHLRDPLPQHLLSPALAHKKLLPPRTLQYAYA